jgi:carboxylesterase
MSVASLDASFDAARRSGATGALMLHGVTGDPETLRPVIDALTNAGIEVEAPLLPGHGSTTDVLAATGYADWLAGARASLARLRERCASVVVVGLSMGGTLALDLASTDHEIIGLVLVNPLAEPVAAVALDILRGGLAAGMTAMPFHGGDLKERDPDYASAAAAPISALISLLEALGPLAERLGVITAPVLLCSSRVDHVVPTSTGDFLASHLTAPLERVTLEHSYHLATLDGDRADIAERTVAFVARVGATR